MGSKKLLGRILLLFLLIFHLAFSDAQAGDKLRTRDFGLIRYGHVHSNLSSIESIGEELKHGNLGLVFNMTNYAVSLEKSVSLGYYTGSGFQLLFPPEFKFVPYEGAVDFPWLTVDAFKLGAALSLNVAEEIRLVTNAGVALNAGVKLAAYDNVSYETTYWGFLPELGTRLFLNDDFNIGFAVRMGHWKAQSYVDWNKSGSSYSAEAGHVMLTIGLNTNVIRSGSK